MVASIEEAEQCLAFQHSWDRLGGLEREGRSRHMGFRINWHCVQCGSDRIDTCDIYGRLMYRQYLYSSAFKAVSRPDYSDSYTRKEMFRAQYIRGNRTDIRLRRVK